MRQTAAEGQHTLAVEVRGLQVQRGATRVFDGLDLQVRRGRITGLLGPSGCGKTTLMRAVVGVQARQGGQITVLGQPAGSVGLRSKVAYATQSAATYGNLTVKQNLRYFARLLGAPAGQVERVAEQVGLTPQLNQRVDSLSGGQLGRASLAVALLGNPELLVLDEPTVGLDPVLRKELWGLFRELAANGVTLIVSSHVMDEALHCDQLLLMRSGRVVADTTPTELLASTGTSDPESAFLTLISRSPA